jgi:hypothetical protein
MRLLATSNPMGGIANLAFAQSMFVNTQLFTLNGQSFWDFLKNFIPSPWMEFYTESGGRTIVTDTFSPPALLFPGMNYVVSRSVPYSNPLLGVANPVHIPETILYELNALSLLIGGDFVIITDEDITNKTLGFDCSNQATVFRATYGAGATNLCIYGQDKPIQSVGPLNPFASGGMGTFGKIEMTQAINCTQLFDAGTPEDTIFKTIVNTVSVPGIMSKPALSNLLAVWFRNQSRFREGTITTRMIPYARAGMYLLYLPTMSGKKPENLRDIGIYYIDSIDDHYSISDKEVDATTTFHVIRGLPLPATIAQTALLLFDFEILPPVSGIFDGEFQTLFAVRKALLGGV